VQCIDPRAIFLGLICMRHRAQIRHLTFYVLEYLISLLLNYGR